MRKSASRVLSGLLVAAMTLNSFGMNVAAKTSQTKNATTSIMKVSASDVKDGEVITGVYDEDWEGNIYTIPSGMCAYVENASEDYVDVKAFDDEGLGGEFYYVAYDEEGNITYDQNYYATISQNGNCYISYRDEQSHKIFVAKDDASKVKVTTSSDSKLRFEKIEEGKSYEVNNTSKKNVSIKIVDLYDTDEEGNDLNDLSSVRYDENGNCNYMDVHAVANMDLTEDIDTIVVTANKLKDKTGYFYYPSDYYENGLSIKESENPAFATVELKAGKKYVVHKPQKLTMDFQYEYEDEYVMDILSYDKDGDVDYTGNTGVPYGYENCDTIYLDVKSVNASGPLYYPYKYKGRGFTIEETDEEFFQEETIENGAVVKMTNSSNKSMSFYVDKDQDVEYQVLRFSEYDRSTEAENSSDEYCYINSNATMYIQAPEDKAITIKVPSKLNENGAMKVTKKDCALEDVLKYGQEYEFTFRQYYAYFDIYAEEGEEEEELYSEESSIDYFNVSILNETTNEIINEFVVDTENNKISISDAAVEKGDQLEFKFRSYDSTTTVKATVGDEKTTFEVAAYENGYVDVRANGDETKYCDKVVLYDKKGNIVKDEYDCPVYSQGIWDGHIVLYNVEEGEYTLVYLQANGEGESWIQNSLADFEKIGAVKDKDYFQTDIKVENCKATKVDFTDKTIENRGIFDYLKTSKLFVSEDAVTLGKMIMVSLEYSINKERLSSIDDAKITTYFTDALRFKEGSVVMNGEPFTNYELDNSGQFLTLHPTEEEGTFNFYVTPTQYSDWAYIQSEFSIINEDKNIDIQQDIGMVDVVVPKLSLNAPSVSVKKEVTVSGLTAPENEVSIYVDGKAVEKVTAKSDGTYKAVVGLGEAGYHEIYATAKVDGEEVNSGEAYVEYDTEAIVAVSNEFYYGDDESIDLADSECQNLTVVFDSSKKYHYELEIANDKNVAVVMVGSTRNGVTTYIRATKDKETGKWITKDKFNKDDDYVPGMISYKYYTYDQISADRNQNGEYEELDGLGSYVRDYVGEEIATEVAVDESTDDSSNYEAKYTFSKEKNKVAEKNGKDITVNYSQKTTKKTMTEKELSKEGFTKLSKDSGLYTKYTYANNTLKVETYAAGYVNSFVANVEGVTDSIQNAADFANMIGQIAGIDGSVVDLPDEFGYFTAFLGMVDDLTNADYMNLPAAQRENMINAIVLSNMLKFGVSMLDVNPILGFTVGLAMDYLMDAYLSSYAEYLRNGGTMDALEYFFSFRWIIDPSGYVYDKETNERLKGVKATLYYQDENGEAVKWNAEEYSQINSQYTDEEGNYAWDVPEGQWKVVFEFAGYATTETDWLPVPPPQTNVNVAMVKDGSTPEDPDDPEKPGTSEEPTTPDDPTKPGTSEEPTTPDNPAKPGTSEEPTTPDSPAKPGTSEEPTKPGQTTTNPTTPEGPGSGNTTVTPGTTTLAEQTITTAKIKTYKASKLKKKKATFNLKAKTTGNGKLSYKVTKGKSKYITVSKSGKVTLKKGCKKGTYKIKITAAATDKYIVASKIVSIKVK